MLRARHCRNDAVVIILGLVTAIAMATAHAAPGTSNAPQPSVANAATPGPTLGVAWQPRALRSDQQLTDLCAAAPWRTSPTRDQTANLDRLDGVAINAQRGASFWAAPATVTRIIVVKGACAALTVARRVGDAENFVTAQTQLPVTTFTDQQRGVTLIEPAGPGAAVWLSCVEPSVLVAQQLDETPVRLAWEQARVAVREWINADAQPLQPPPAIPGDDGSIAAELRAAAWLAHVAPPHLRTPWRLAAAETAIMRARPSSDPYVNIVDRAPSADTTPAQVSLDDQRWGAVTTPWQFEITGPAQLEWWLMQPQPALGWVGQRVNATLLIDGAPQVYAPDTATTPNPVASRALAFPAAVDPRWGRRLSWTTAVPPGRHVITVQATAAAAADIFFTRIRVITRQPRWRDASGADDATAYRNMQAALRGDDATANAAVKAVAMLLQVEVPTAPRAQATVCQAALQSPTLPSFLQPWLKLQCDRVVAGPPRPSNQIAMNPIDPIDRRDQVEIARAAWQAAPWQRAPRLAYLAAQRAAAWQAVPASGAPGIASSQVWSMPRRADTAAATELAERADPTGADRDELSNDSSANAQAIALNVDGQPQTISLRSAAPNDLRLPLLRLDIGRAEHIVRFPDIKIDGHSYLLATRELTNTVTIALAPGSHTIAVSDAVFATARGPLLETGTLVRRSFVNTDATQQFAVANATTVIVDFRPIMTAPTNSPAAQAGQPIAQVSPSQATAQVLLRGNGGQIYQLTSVAKRRVPNAVSLQHGTALADMPTITLAFEPGTNTITSSASPGGLLRLKQMAALQAATTATATAPHVDAAAAPPIPRISAPTTDDSNATLAFAEVVSRITALSRQIATDSNDVAARLARAELLATQGLVTAARIDLTVLAGFNLRDDLAQRFRTTLANLQDQTTALFLPVQPADSPLLAGTMIAPAEAAATLDLKFSDADQAALVAQLTAGEAPSVQQPSEPGVATALANLRRLLTRNTNPPSLRDLVTLGQHPHVAVRRAALQWALDHPAPALAPLVYLIAQSLTSANEFATKRAVMQAQGLSQWDTLRSVSAQAGYERVWLPVTDNLEPLNQLRSALLAIPWSANHGVVLDAGQSLTLRDQDAAAVELFCAPERNGACVINIRRNQNQQQVELAAGQRQTVALQALMPVQPLPTGPQPTTPTQLEVALVSPRAKLALRLLDGNGAAISAMVTARPTFLASAEKPLSLTTLGPTVLHVTALGYAPPYDSIAVQIQGVTQPNPLAISRVLTPSIQVLANRKVILTAATEYAINIWQDGPVTVALTPKRGTVAINIQRRGASANAEPPTPTGPDALAAVVPSAPLPTISEPGSQWSTPWLSTPHVLANALPPGPTYSVVTLAGRESLGELESDLVDVNTRVELSIQARASNRYGFGLLSVRGRQVLGTGATETLRVLVNSRRMGAGIAWTADALLGHSRDVDTDGWMARASLLAKRPFFLSRRWRIVPALMLLAAHAPTPTTVDADPLIFSRYRNDHPLQLQASSLLLWQPYADQRVSARFEGWSNSDGASIDTALAQFAWYGLLEWQPLRGPVFSLRYQPSYRFADADRRTAIWRHDALAGLVWPLGHQRGAWTLGVDLDIYKASNRSLSNSLTLWLRWDTSGRGLLDFRPDEFIFADYLGATAWRQ